MRDEYDTMLIEKGIFDDIKANAAIKYGIVELYLVGDMDDYIVTTPEWWVLNFIEEGRTQQRHDFTAEELFILAHEYDVANLGLGNMWPQPKPLDNPELGQCEECGAITVQTSTGNYRSIYLYEECDVCGHTRSDSLS